MLFIWWACDINGFIFASLCHLSVTCHICGNTLPSPVSAEPPAWLSPRPPVPMVLNCYFLWSGGWWFWDHLGKPEALRPRWIKWVLITLWLTCREHKPCVSKQGKHLAAVSEGIWRLRCSAANNGMTSAISQLVVWFSLKFGPDLCFKLKNN